MKTQKHRLAPNGDRFIDAILFMMGSLAIGLVEPSVLFIIDTHLTLLVLRILIAALNIGKFTFLMQRDKDIYNAEVQTYL